MNSLSCLDTVSELFPTYPRSELATRLLCASSVDDVIEELFAEQQEPPKEYDLGVYLLKDMFPNEPLDSLAAHLQRYQGDVEQCIDHLMKPDLSLRLCELTGISIEQLRTKIRKLEDLEKSRQRGENILASQNYILLRALTEVIFEDRGLAWDGNNVVKRQASKQEEELKLCVSAEVSLQCLNYLFLHRCLIYFNNDLVKVLETARLYTEASLERLTYTINDGFSIPGFIPENLIVLDVPANAEASLHLQSLAIASTPVTNQKRDSKINSNSTTIGKFSTILDLHGYTVAEAVSLANATAAAWWEEEQRLRIENGNLENVGSKAAYVEDLRIITGRGIHSIGGPKIRGAVIRLFAQNGYIIEEMVGNIIVRGKRRVYN